MSGRTWLMMILILALNWGGFAVCLALTAKRGSR